MHFFFAFHFSSIITNNHQSLGLKCPAGKTSFKGALECIPCEPGTFSPHDGSPSCTKCNSEKREYASISESTNCSVCDRDAKSTGLKCEALGIDVSLEIPSLADLWINGTDKRNMFLDWTYGGKNTTDDEHYVTSFVIEMCIDQSFPTNMIRQTSVAVNNGQGHLIGKETRLYTYSVTLSKPAYAETWYTRVSAIVMDEVGQRRLSNAAVPKGGWLTWSCPELKAQYLNASDSDPSEWKCNSCPQNAYCDGKLTFNEVRARFGYWRNIKEGEPLTSSTFIPCIFPAACLGACSCCFEYFRLFLFLCVFFFEA